jgi:hypothetical protein
MLKLLRVTQKTEGGGKSENFDSDVSSDDITDVKIGVAGMPGHLNNQADHIGATYQLIVNLPAREIKQGESWVDSARMRLP